MKAGYVVAALVVAAAAVGVWLWRMAEPAPTVSAHRAAPAPVSASLPAEAAKGRTLLSHAQLQQALAAGTLDRPVKSLLAVNAPLKFGDYAWNDTAIPAGPTWIRVDLGTQLISIFRAGHEIGTSVIVYGGDNKRTPPGKMQILAKARDHRSSLYDAPMPYTLRLTDDGISIHGSTVRWGAATHGCIGVPLAFAERLFGAAHVGDEVVIIPAAVAVSQPT
jgi:lipoprotein-anchoring transpeptidase ErfK/SrfK